MWMVWLLGFFLLAAPAFAEPGFDEKYERDYNIFNPINQYDAEERRKGVGYLFDRTELSTTSIRP